MSCRYCRTSEEKEVLGSKRLSNSDDFGRLIVVMEKSQGMLTSYLKKKNQKQKPKSVMRPDTREKVLFHIQGKRGFVHRMSENFIDFRCKPLQIPK